MGVIFDTSVLIGLEKASSRLDQFILGREKEPFGISAITVSELLHGVHRADTEKRRIIREAFVGKIIEVFTVFPFDIGAARIYARIWASLAKRGKTVGAHDLIIAATCISLGFSLATLDVRDYSLIEGLNIARL
ncbi:MAG: type II toxin-antitoxin system VapC family toxin [Candidatus Aminicenantes bacterium]|nr:type II toxin-antitoxin system VapC family toxin [Candidatus Aminicenantes bacterium]